METKTCPKCGETKPLSGEFWSRDRTSKNGFYGYCKSCKGTARIKAYRHNPEKEKAVHTKYRKDNPEKIKKMQSDYRKNNPEQMHAYSQKWRSQNPEKIRAKATRATENCTDGYVKAALRKSNAPITPETIKERRDQILRKRLCVPKDTDIHQPITTEQPAWAMG